MHRLIASSAILEHELSEFRLLVERRAGIVLDCPNSALATHLMEFFDAQHLDSATALLDQLRASDQTSILPQLLDGMLNTNTGFFRHPGALGVAEFLPMVRRSDRTPRRAAGDIQRQAGRYLVHLYPERAARLCRIHP